MQKWVNWRSLADLTFSRCFVQSVSSTGRNEVIPMALKSWHPYLSGHLRKEHKIRKRMEIAAFKVKSRNLPMLTFGHSDLNIWSYRSPIIANSIVLDSWLKAYQRSTLQLETMSYEGDMIFQRWQLNSANKQVSWRNESKLRSEASKPTSKFLFQQFSS